MSQDSARFVILANPSAGGGRTGRALPRVQEAMTRREMSARLVVTTALEHACEQALSLVGTDETPVAAGGDGLIGAIAGALAGTGATLGVIPAGRGNDFARVLGIPLDDLEGAVEVLNAGNVREVDVGEVNGHRFVGIASAGFDSDANRIANQARFVRGNLVYAYAGIRALLGWRPARFTVIADGRTIEFSGYSAAAANNRAYGGGMMLAPHAELDDGAFDIVLISDVAKRRFLSNLPKVFKGTHVDEENVTVLRASDVEFHADRPFDVYADGEALTELPAKLRLLPRALRVIAPA
jgi:YegS/Rv2252/BmrU family lipid kinase